MLEKRNIGKFVGVRDLTMFFLPSCGSNHQKLVMSKHSCDVLILGGGMVGLSVAHQLIERGITNRITVVDKELDLGLHILAQQRCSSWVFITSQGH